MKFLQPIKCGQQKRFINFINKKETILHHIPRQKMLHFHNNRVLYDNNNEIIEDDVLQPNKNIKFSSPRKIHKYTSYKDTFVFSDWEGYFYLLDKNNHLVCNDFFVDMMRYSQKEKKRSNYIHSIVMDENDIYVVISSSKLRDFYVYENSRNTITDKFTLKCIIHGGINNCYTNGKKFVIDGFKFNSLEIPGISAKLLTFGKEKSKEKASDKKYCKNNYIFDKNNKMNTIQDNWYYNYCDDERINGCLVDNYLIRCSMVGGYITNMVSTIVNIENPEEIENYEGQYMNEDYHPDNKISAKLYDKTLYCKNQTSLLKLEIKPQQRLDWSTLYTVDVYNNTMLTDLDADDKRLQFIVGDPSDYFKNDERCKYPKLIHFS